MIFHVLNCNFMVFSITFPASIFALVSGPFLAPEWRKKGVNNDAKINAKICAKNGPCFGGVGCQQRLGAVRTRADPGTAKLTNFKETTHHNTENNKTLSHAQRAAARWPIFWCFSMCSPYLGLVLMALNIAKIYF